MVIAINLLGKSHEEQRLPGHKVSHSNTASLSTRNRETPQNHVAQMSPADTGSCSRIES
jgi:hypothetical protein